MSLAVPMLEIAQERLRGVGRLSAQRAEKKISLPLSDVKISAKVAERVATVVLTQAFQNPYPDHLEAVYIFPLPGGVAVSDFEMKVGNRRIRGKVEERGEARRQYQEALNEGKRAALMEKERDDVFTVQVGNIAPKEEVSIKITYSERLVFFEEGNTELRLPLVVAPRYTPGQSLMRDQVGDGVEFDTDIVPDASRISPPRLVKGFDPKIGLNIDVTILWDESEEGSEIQDLCCSQHATRTSSGREGVKISLARSDEALDRDFVLRWTVSGATLRSSLLLYRDPNQFSEREMSYGMLSLIPPRNKALSQARDIVFIVDRSGSMQGIKMASAARACALLLATLGPRDRFAIQSYSSDVQWYQPPAFSYGVDGYFMPADYWGLEQGEKYLRGINANGGTETYNALSSAITTLEHRQDSHNRTPVIVLLTDGEVSDESRIFKEAQTRLGEARLFTIGIDSAVNQGFLQRLAEIGRATATFVTPGAQLETALVTVGREIGSPLVVDLKIYDVDSDVQLSTVAPSKMTDLFKGRATSTFFMLKKVGKVRVSGKYVNGNAFETVVEAKEVELPAIAQLWAKTRIADLEDWYRIDPTSQEQIKQQIISLSIAHKILTRFTAFVAVDHEEITNQDGTTRKVVQPVEMPASWEMQAAHSASTAIHTAAPTPTYKSSVSRADESMGSSYSNASSAKPSAAPIAMARPQIPAPQALQNNYEPISSSANTRSHRTERAAMPIRPSGMQQEQNINPSMEIQPLSAPKSKFNLLGTKRLIFTLIGVLVLIAIIVYLLFLRG
jgi:Ca-activated chloride channel homolog